MLGKDKLNAILVLISKALIHSCIFHEEFVSVNNVLREYNEIKEEIKTFCGIHYIETIQNYFVSCKESRN